MNTILRIVMFFALVSLVVVTTTAATPKPAREPWQIQLPVVLDGVPTSAVAFNALRITTDLTFVSLDNSGTVYVFRSLEAAKRFMESRSRKASTKFPGLASPNAGPSASHGNCYYHVWKSIAEYHKDQYCYGAEMNTWVPPSYAISSLVPSGFNDTISSLACPWDTTWTLYCTIWEHVNYSGSSWWIYPGTYLNALNGYGWDNRISSIIHYTQN